MIGQLRETDAVLATTAKMAALGEMASELAHEMNTPLSIILIKVEQLLEFAHSKTNSSEEIQYVLREISDTVKRVSQVTNALRFFSGYKKNGDFEQKKVAEILRATAGFCMNKFKQNDVELIMNIDSLHPYTVLECRPVEISQVLMGLLSNALDAVRKLQKPDRWVRVDVIESLELIRFEVKDGGESGASESQQKILQPTFTIKETTKGFEHGLNSSRGIIEAHLGRIFLDTASKNTCFVVEFPKRQNLIYTVQAA